VATEDNRAVQDFHSLFYARASQTWGNTFWLGHQVLKCPLDLWIYQEIIAEIRPALIIETGTYLGGSTLFLASICDLLGHGAVLSIDSCQQPGRPRHRRITYLTGSSTAEATLKQVRRRVKGEGPIMVILDSGHGEDHVLSELRAYGPLVTPGSYLIVEDTNLNGHPVLEDHGPGPGEAIAIYLAETNEFVPDESKERFMLTFNPGGFLKKRPAPVSRFPASRNGHGGFWPR
jgi:cephalosporin hydroxylase